MRWLLLSAAAGCFTPSPLRGQACASWCPPPESCVNGECVVEEGSSVMGSDPMPIDANYMFVTSEKKAPKDFGGVSGADAWCNTLAAAVPLPGQYVAWLSTLDTNADTRLLEKNARGWYRPDGKPFTDQVSDLTSGTLYYPPRITEQGIDIGGSDDAIVATGTYSDGTEDFVAGDCLSWTTDQNVMTTGLLDAGYAAWTGFAMTDCTTPAHIYCFGIDKTVAVPPPQQPTSSRLAFVVVATLGGGLSSLDTQCKTAAQAKGITGNFIAWVSTTGSSAALRLTGTTPWRRKDNVIAMTPDLTMSAPIDQTLDGSMTGTYVWTGAAQPGDTASQSCNDWTSTATTMSGLFGYEERSVLADAFGSGSQNCGSTSYIYCLEQ